MDSMEENQNHRTTQTKSDILQDWRQLVYLEQKSIAQNYEDLLWVIGFRSIQGTTSDIYA